MRFRWTSRTGGFSRCYHLGRHRHHEAPVAITALTETDLEDADIVNVNDVVDFVPVSRADIEQAAKAAQSEDFIQRLPRGMDTRIGQAVTST